MRPVDHNKGFYFKCDGNSSEGLITLSGFSGLSKANGL